MRRRILATLMLGATVLGCAGQKSTPAGEEAEAVQSRSLSDVLADHSEELMDIDGVTMVYEGQLEDGRTCLVIGVVELSDELRARLPQELEGYPVDVRQSGEIRPLSGD